eukprot:482922-Pelagomonas_calceolata.AAC.1
MLEMVTYYASYQGSLAEARKEEKDCANKKAWGFGGEGAGRAGVDTRRRRVRHCEYTRPGQQLEAAQRQHADLCKLIGVKLVTQRLRTISQDNSGTCHTEHTPGPGAAYDLAFTGRALEETSLNNHHQDQARGTA